MTKVLYETTDEKRMEEVKEDLLRRDITFSLERCKRHGVPVQTVLAFYTNNVDILECGGYEQWVRVRGTDEVYAFERFLPSRFTRLSNDGNKEVLSEYLEKFFDRDDVHIYESNGYHVIGRLR